MKERSRAPAGCAAALLLSLAIAVPSAAAQTTTGDIQGVVSAQAGGPLDGVDITVTNVGTGATRRTRTTAGGRFAVTGLAPGSYEVLAALEGFASQRQERVEIGIAQTIVSELELRKAPLPDTLTLAAQPSVLELRHSDVSARIERVEIEGLPLRHRRPLDLVTLAPGFTTAPDVDGPIATGADAARIGLAADGVDLWPLSSGPAPLPVAAERPYVLGRSTVRDIYAISSAPPAAFGREGGALVHVVTRSGAARVAGEVFQAFRDAGLAANTRASQERDLPTPDARAHQFGGSAGGPLAPGHLLFASYEGLRDRQENVVHTRGALPVSLAALASNWTRTRNQDLLFVRTDHRLGTGGRLTLRYNQLDLDGTGLDGGGPRRTRSTSGPGEIGIRAGSATLAAAFGASFVNELRTRYAHLDETAGAFGAQPHAHILNTGALALQTGRSGSVPRDTGLHRLQLADSVMWASTRHMAEAGADLRVDNWRYSTSPNTRGTYVFRSPAGFDSGVPNGPGESYAQAFLADGAESLTVEPDARDLVLFVQDKWLLNDRLTLDAGLRYDWQGVASPQVTNPDPGLLAAGIDTARLDADTDAWEPRVGVAWAPSSRHVARAAYGVMHGRIPVRMVAAAHAYNGVDVRTATFSASRGDPLPAYPDRLDAMPFTAREDLLFFDEGFERARFRHASASYEWQWMPTTSIGGSYFHVRGDRLPRVVDINVGAGTPALFTVRGEEGTVAALRFAPGPLPAFGRVVRYESTAASRYNGAAVELRRRSDQGWQYRVTYTLGKVTDTSPGRSSVFPEGPDTRDAVTVGSRVATTAAPADHDLRHHLVLSSVYSTDVLAARYDGFVENLLRNWRVGFIYRAATGLPYTASVDADIDGDLNRWNEVAPGTTRNEFRRPAAMQLDARISRYFLVRDRVRVTANADIFNVLNSAHYRDVDTTLYSVSGTTLVRNPRFGERFDQVVPRTVQLGVTVAF